MNNITIDTAIIQAIKEDQTLPKGLAEKLEDLAGQSFYDYSVLKTALFDLLGDETDEVKAKLWEKFKQDDASDIYEAADDNAVDEASNEATEGDEDTHNPLQSHINIEKEHQTVYELVVRKQQRGLLELDPDFQRNFVWKRDQQSRFIESLLLNFPLPPIYLNRTQNGKLIVVDGRQRITTLKLFMDNKLKLRGLTTLPHLNGLRFRDLIKLDARYQTRVEDTQLFVYIIPPSVPVEVVYDIFNRINTGGTQLQRQEIRNCIFIGKSTALLGKLSQKDYFKQAIDNNISPNRLKDQEAILRCLAFRIQNKDDYKGGMNAFVDRSMQRINQMNDNEIASLEQDFEKAMTWSYDFFEGSNFRIPRNGKRGRINIALMEAVANWFMSQEEDYLTQNKEAIQAGFAKLVAAPALIDAVRVSTSDQSRVAARFKLVEEYLTV